MVINRSPGYPPPNEEHPRRLKKKLVWRIHINHILRGAKEAPYSWHSTTYLPLLV